MSWGCFFLGMAVGIFAVLLFAANNYENQRSACNEISAPKVCDRVWVAK